MLNDIAHTLDQAAASASSVAQVSQSKNITLPEAYEIQKLSIQHRLDRGEKLIGYKCGKGHNAFLNDCKLHKTKNDKRVF